jgi:hypothetical protein
MSLNYVGIMFKPISKRVKEKVLKGWNLRELTLTAGTGAV